MKVELIEQLGITPTPGGIDKLLQLQDTQNYYDRGIVNLRMGGSLSSGFDTDDWELDDYNQQIQELKEEKRSLGFSGENSQRKTRINQALRGLRLERLKKRFRGFGSGIAETLGQGLLRQHISQPQLDQFADETQANIVAEAAGEEIPFETPAQDVLGFGESSLFEGLLPERGFESLLPERGATAAEVPIDETGYALPPEVQEEQWVTLDPLRLGWRIRTAPHGEFSGNLEKQFGNFSEEYSPWKARNKRYNKETRQWEFRAPPDYMEKKAWISAMRGPLRSRNKMAEGGIVNLAGGGGARGGGASAPLINPFEKGDAAAVAAAQANPFSPYYQGDPQLHPIFNTQPYTPYPSAMSEFGQTIKDMPWADIGLGAATGGIWNLFKNVGQWGANKWEGVGSRDRLLSELNNAWANASPTERDEIELMMNKIENMSTDEFQKATEGYAIPGYDPDTGQTFKTLPGQDMRAGMTGASAMMMMPVYDAMYNVGGPGKARGAGSTYGQSQRMQRKEQNKINKRADLYDMFGNEQSYLDQGYPPEQAKYYADTFMQTYGTGESYRDMMAAKNFGTRGVGYGTIAERSAMGQDVQYFDADPKGRPANWSDIYAHYKQTGSWDESPVATWGGG